MITLTKSGYVTNLVVSRRLAGNAEHVQEIELTIDGGLEYHEAAKELDAIINDYVTRGYGVAEPWGVRS